MGWDKDITYLVVAALHHELTSGLDGSLALELHEGIELHNISRDKALLEISVNDTSSLRRHGTDLQGPSADLILAGSAVVLPKFH